MLPAKLAMPGTEHAHQRAFFAWINIAAKVGFSEAKQVCKGRVSLRDVAEMAEHSLLLFHAIPNGGMRHKPTAQKLRAEGVKPGVFDTFLPVSKPREPEGLYNGLYIEFKHPGRRRHTNGGLTEAQVDFGANVREMGYYAAVAYAWHEAANFVMAYYGNEVRFVIGVDVDEH